MQVSKDMKIAWSDDVSSYNAAPMLDSLAIEIDGYPVNSVTSSSTSTTITTTTGI